MKKLILGLFVMYFATNSINAQQFDKAPFLQNEPESYFSTTSTTPVKPKGNLQNKAPFDIDFQWTITDSLSAGNITGVAFTGTELWFSQWDGDSIRTADLNGARTGAFVVPGVSGIRSLTWDGTYIYAGTATDAIFEIDPVTKTLNSTITLPAASVGARMCTYDPNADNGNGGFWIGNFTSAIELWSRTGTILATIPQSTSNFPGIYGGAVDTFTAGGPYLLVYYQGGVSNNTIGWIDLSTNTPTGNNYNVNDDLSANRIAGGLFVADNIIPGEQHILAVSQNSPTLSGILTAYELGLPPAADYDAVIGSASIFATGRAGYALVPPSQDDPSVFQTLVRNDGSMQITNVSVNGTLNPGANNVTGNAASVGGFSSSIIESGSFTPSAATAYNGNFNVTITETDANTADNTASFSFTSGSISDSTLARENEIAPSNSLGFGAANLRAGVVYDFTSADTITSITYFINAVGDAVQLFVADFNRINNSSNVEIYNSGDITPSASGANTFSINVPVTPGTYIVGIVQTTANNFGVGQTSSVVRAGTSFTGTFPNWTDQFGGGFPGTWMIRLGLSRTNQPATLSAFDLLSPSTGARIETDLGNPSTPVNIDWNASSITNGAPTNLTYDWLLDTQGGDFSSPLATIPSNNNGIDTVLTLTLGAIDTLLNDLGIPQGDSVDVIWTVRTSAGASSLEANNGPFDIKLVRGLPTGLLKSNFETSISMYPNPTEGVLTINDSRNIVESISILNLIGSEVKRFNNAAKTNQYDLNDLSNGVYLVKFITKEGNYTQKLIVE